MKIHRFSSQAVRKIFLVLLLVVLALQSSGTIGLAAPAGSARYLEESTSKPLSCGCPSIAVQIVLLIDDSGSMLRANDKNAVRDQMATKLVEKLESFKGDPSLGIKDVQVGVIHFSKDVITKDTNKPTNPPKPPVNLEPRLIDVTESTIGDLTNTINWKPDSANRTQTTDFTNPLLKAKELFTNGDCIRRSIVLFTDGTPEDESGRLAGAKLEDAFKRLSTDSQDIPQLDGIYLVGFKGDANYFSEGVKTSWFNIIRNWTNLQSKLSASQAKVPRLVLYSSQELLNQWQAEAANPSPASTSRINFDELAKYENLKAQLEQSAPGAVQLKLVDNNGQVVMPGGDPSKVLTNSAANLEWKVLVTPISQDTALSQSDQGNDSYTFPWTPANYGTSLFNVGYSLTDDQGNILLNCSGMVSLVIPPPSGPSNISVTTVIQSSRDEIDRNKSTILPVLVTSEQNIKDVKWNTLVVKDQNGKVIEDAHIEAADTDAPGTPKRSYNLKIGPLNQDVKTLTILLGGRAITDKGEINIPPGESNVRMPSIPPVCLYGPAWQVWFWPLLIGLIGLMILLLVFRAGSRRDTGDDPRANLDVFRNRNWHVMFWPVLGLTILLLLARFIGPSLTCIVPPWLFLAALLLWMITVLMLRFIPGHNTPRSRSWALFIVLLALAFLGFLIVPISAITLLWLVVVLLSLWAIVWYISAYEPFALRDPVSLSLTIQGSHGEPENGVLKVPVRLNYQGSTKPASQIAWQSSAFASSQKFNTYMTPEEKAEPGEYSLTIEGIATNIHKIDVQASADVAFEEGYSISTPQASTTIYLSVPTFNLAIGSSSEFLDGSVTLALEVDCEGNGEDHDTQWDVQEWHVISVPSGKDLSNEVVRGEERGRGSLAISGISTLLANTTGVQVSADVKVDGQVVKTPQASATIRVIPMPIPPIVEYVYEQVSLNVEFSSPCWPFGETVVLRGTVEYLNSDKVRESISISPASWKPTVRILPMGPVVGARIGSFNEETGEFEIIVDPVIVTPESFDKDHPPAEIQIQVCADGVLGNGHTVEIIGKTATIPLCKDDLTELEGIGPVYGRLLNKHNIFTFRQLATVKTIDLTAWLDKDGYQREDPKTWPQQAELADIAKHYEDQNDNYIAYKAWLDRGSEPDERDKEEDERRKPPVALPWNRIAEFTPVVLRKVFNPPQASAGPIAFPIQLNREGEIKLADVEWKVNVRVLPGENGKADEIQATVTPVDAGKGIYELVIPPVPDKAVREIQVMVQAFKSGRSIEIYKGKAITIQVAPPPLPPDNLEELEGIGPVYRGILNKYGIFTFSQLAGKSTQELSQLLNKEGYEREDPKTWAQQAKLASIAKYGSEEDKRSYEAYKAWLHRGVEPDEVHVLEEHRRKEVLVWYGTAEATEANAREEGRKNPAMEFPNRHARK